MFFRVVGRLTVRFLAGLGRFIAGFFKGLIHHPVSSFFSFLILAAVIASWTYWDGFGLKFGSSNSSVVTAQASDAASGKSEEFLNAYGKLDASIMWNLLSDNMKKSQQANGISNAEGLQKQINSKLAEIGKGDESKPKFRFLWNHGQANSDGSAIDIFRGDVDWAAAGGAMPTLLAYVIETDGSGKIKNVITQSSADPNVGDPILTAAFPSNTAKSAKGAGATAGSGAPNNKRSQSTDELMAGLTNFDAKKVWNSLSPSYQKELNGQGVTIDTMQKAFDNFKKDPKLGYVGYTYQVSTNYNNGIATDAYVAALKNKDQVLQFNYMILLDGNGKVTAIGTDDPILKSGIGQQSSTQGG